MDIFGIKALRKENAQLINAVKALQTTNINAALQQMTTLVFPTWQVYREIESYQLFDDIYSVVTRLATAAAKIPFYVCDASGEEIEKGQAVDILNQLTYFKRQQLYTYLYLSGECFIYKETYQLGPNRGKMKFHFLHPNYVTLILSSGYPQEIKGYRYQDNNITFTLPYEDVIFIRRFNPTTIMLNAWRGMSPIKSLAQRLTRLQANMSASVSQMQNGGVPSIVYDKTPGLEIGVMGQHKENFSRFLRNSDNKGAPYFTGGELGVLQLGLSLADLDALALADVDFDKICNAYGISSTLFNNKKASTESNVKEMRVDMYTNAVMPIVHLVTDALTDGINMGVYAKPDTDHIPELQEDMKMKADAWAALPSFVPNEMREAMGQDLSSDPNADKMYIKTNYVAIDDLNINVDPIDNGQGDYTNNQ